MRVTRWLALVILVLAVLGCGGVSDSPPVPWPIATPTSIATPTPDIFEESANTKVIDKLVGAVMRLALEYEVELDESTLRELFTDSSDLKLTGMEQLVVLISDFWLDEGDYADGLKESLLDEGITPRVWVQELAEALNRRP